MKWPKSVTARCTTTPPDKQYRRHRSDTTPEEHRAIPSGRVFLSTRHQVHPKVGEVQRSKSSRYTHWLYHNILLERRSKTGMLNQLFVNAPIPPLALVCLTCRTNLLCLWGWTKGKERWRERNRSETTRAEIIGKADTKNFSSSSLPFSISLTPPYESVQRAFKN